MTILYIMIILLVTIILFLSSALYIFLKKNIYLSENEKEFILFSFTILSDYGDDLGIHSKEQHEKLIIELNKIKNKLSIK
jgi:hypothetical protein